jgi:hypothetical protein
MTMTHQTQILNHLKQGKSITQAEAINLFNCYRLSAVINRLRNLGHEIVTHQEPNHNSNGNHARYEYWEFKA